MELLRQGHLCFDDLITIRRGELAYQPLSAIPETVAKEFLKLKGKGGTWCCASYDEATKGCLRYDHRPQACQLLNCTDTGPLLDIAGQDLLSRYDCIDPDDPLLPMVRQHEQNCPCPDLLALSRTLEQGGIPGGQLLELEQAVNADLAYRTRISQRSGLTLSRELFYFGRPLFHLIQPLGIRSESGSNQIHLSLATG